MLHAVCDWAGLTREDAVRSDTCAAIVQRNRAPETLFCSHSGLGVPGNPGWPQGDRLMVSANMVEA